HFVVGVAPHGTGEFEGFLERAPDIYCALLPGAAADVLAHSPDDLGPALDSVVDHPEYYLPVFGSLVTPDLQHRRCLGDGVEHVIEFMGDAGSHLPDGRVPLRVGDASLQVHDLGNVTNDDQCPDDRAVNPHGAG